MLSKDEFEKNVIFEPNTGCWLYPYGIEGGGYGVIFRGGIRKKAHRLSYELYTGLVPAGLHVLHTCDVRMCVNPQHLFLGTHDDNMKDKVAKGRQMKGEDQPFAKLTRQQVEEIRKATGTQKEIGKIFGVGQDEVSRIKNYKVWK